MMKVKIPVFILVLSVLIFTGGCKGKNRPEKEPAPKEDSLIIDKEISTLINYLEANGDYVNSKEYPSLIKASIVHESLDKNILVIDIRPSEQFSEGHVKGAVNKKFEELPSFLETEIRPFEYDKIIIVSDDGQIACYTTSLLRLMGYGNIYAMRWGMSAWNNSYAVNGWLSGVSGKYEDKLEIKVNEKPVIRRMPELRTGLEVGEEIANSRFRKLFSEGTSNVMISAGEVFNNPQNYYVINLDRKDKYDDGHVPGAVRYKPDATLGFPEEMSSIPLDKTIVVYCGTGHNSGFATGYLRLMGYDARTLKYGNNGFMHDKMNKQKTALSWLPFSSADVNDFEIVK